MHTAGLKYIPGAVYHVSREEPQPQPGPRQSKYGETNGGTKFKAKVAADLRHLQEDVTRIMEGHYR